MLAALAVSPAAVRPGLGIAPAIIYGAQAGVTAALAAIAALRRRGAQKVQATHYVDSVEPLFAELVRAVELHPTRAAQAAALAEFDAAWRELEQACGDPALGAAGRRCISDRARGGPLDWFRAYRDRIANIAVRTEAAASLSPVRGGGGADWRVVLGLLAAALAVWMWE